MKHGSLRMQLFVGIEGAGKKISWAIPEYHPLEKNASGTAVPTEPPARHANKAGVLASAITAEQGGLKRVYVHCSVDGWHIPLGGFSAMNRWLGPCTFPPTGRWLRPTNPGGDALATSSVAAGVSLWCQGPEGVELIGHLLHCVKKAMVAISTMRGTRLIWWEAKSSREAKLMAEPS
jgi:hypothetical protein